MAPVEVPVLIAGGGGAGLTSSMLLSRLGVESLLVSALPGTSVLPKVHMLNQRTPWCDTARRLAATTGVPLRAIRIGHLDGDYRDPRCTWLRQRQITAEGALLVRPDRFVAWRSAGAATNPVGELGAALTKVLCRPVG